MIFGFNSEISVGNEVCHIQTEDHGPSHPVIETLAYCRGRIIHRLTSDYSDLANSSSFNEETLRLRAEEQHRSVIETVRAGAVTILPGGTREPSVFSGGIQVKLRNSNSWLSGGTAFLDVEVVRSDDGQPVSDANVEAHLEGAKQETHFAAATDSNGLVHFRFPLPPLEVKGAALVIRATMRSSGDEIRFALRSKPRSTPPEPKA